MFNVRVLPLYIRVFYKLHTEIILILINITKINGVHMEQFNELISAVGGFVWGPVMLILLVGTGVLFTIRLAFLQFRFLPFALKQAFTSRDESAGHEGDVSHFGALMTALSATIGTGNIAGVATAVVLGGPGAIFWMWVTAIFGLATKYAEAILAVKYRIVNEKGEMSGGPMYYLERGCKMKWLAMLFALLRLLHHLGLVVQCNQILWQLL